MELTGVGGGLMVAVAAVLWLVYLVPNWLKRREYLATERNAVRLQQTIRVLAETAEVPAVVRAARAQPMPVAVGRPVVQSERMREDARALVSRRLRRTRALTALALLGSLVVAVAQVSLMVTAGAVAGSWLVLGVAALVALGSLAMLGRLAEVSRSRRSEGARPARRTSLGARQAPAAQRSAEWSPVPLPKPLYLSRPAAGAGLESVPLEAAIAASVQAIRDAEKSTPALRPVAQSRFATMGIVDAAATETPDLDAVLARRRAAG